MPNIPEALDQAEEKLERAEKTPVAAPNIEPKAEKEALSFGELREKESIWQFKVLFYFSILYLYSSILYFSIGLLTKNCLKIGILD